MRSVGGENFGIERAVGFVFSKGLYETYGFRLEQTSSVKNPFFVVEDEHETAGTAPVVENTVPIFHKGFATGDVKQQYVQYAYSLGGLDFVALIECENGNWNPFIESKTNDHGICQLNYRYNKKFIKSDDFKDVYKQLDYCYAKYQVNPNLRYGPNRKIDGQRCSTYVLNRFVINA